MHAIAGIRTGHDPHVDGRPIYENQACSWPRGFPFHTSCAELSRDFQLRFKPRCSHAARKSRAGAKAHSCDNIAPESFTRYRLPPPTSDSQRASGHRLNHACRRSQPFLTFVPWQSVTKVLIVAVESLYGLSIPANGQLIALASSAVSSGTARKRRASTTGHGVSRPAADHALEALGPGFGGSGGDRSRTLLRPRWEI